MAGPLGFDFDRMAQSGVSGSRLRVHFHYEPNVPLLQPERLFHPIHHSGQLPFVSWVFRTGHRLAHALAICFGELFARKSTPLEIFFPLITWRVTRLFGFRVVTRLVIPSLIGNCQPPWKRNPRRHRSPPKNSRRTFQDHVRKIITVTQFKRN